MTAWVRQRPSTLLQAYQLEGSYHAAAQRFVGWVNAKGGMSDCSGLPDGPWFTTLRRDGAYWVNVLEGDWVIFHPRADSADADDTCFELLSNAAFESLYEIEGRNYTETREGLLISSEVDAKIIRNILEALCEKQGISTLSLYDDSKPAANFQLAERLGIRRAFEMDEE